MANRHASVMCLGALLVASSCSPSGEVNPLVLYPASPEGHTAGVRGTLEMEGACLYIVGQGGERWLAAFPSPGTNWNPEDRAVQVGDRALAVGATGEFSGGEMKNGARAISWVQPPAASCDSSKIWLVTALRGRRG